MNEETKCYKLTPKTPVKGLYSNHETKETEVQFQAPYRLGRMVEANLQTVENPRINDV